MNEGKKEGSGMKGDELHASWLWRGKKRDIHCCSRERQSYNLGSSICLMKRLKTIIIIIIGYFGNNLQ